MEIISNRRIFFLAVNTGYTINGIPDKSFLEFYSERSGKGLHCAIIGNVAIPNGFGTNLSTPQIDNNKIWREITSAISIQDTLPGIQLSTTWPSYLGIKGFVANSSADQLGLYKYIASNFSTEYVKMQFASLNKATKLAVDSGFKHVQLHAAHGYFFNLILDNRFSNHHQLSMDLVQEWVESTRCKGVETSVRISTLTGDSEFDLEKSTFLEALVKIPFEYYDVSEGFYNINKRLIYPSLRSILESRMDRTISLAIKYPNKDFIASGKSYPLKYKSLPKNIHIGICRDLIANPNFLDEQDKGCINKMKCHYYSRGLSSISCGQWG